MIARNKIIAFHMFQVRGKENVKEDRDNDFGPPMATATSGPANLHMAPDHPCHSCPPEWPQCLCLLSLMGCSTPSSDVSLLVISMSASNSV